MKIEKITKVNENHDDANRKENGNVIGNSFEIRSFLNVCFPPR